jgi:hypothetical protein
LLGGDARMLPNIKNFGCGLCKKKYRYIKNAYKHNKKKHDGKAKFKDLREMKF